MFIPWDRRLLVISFDGPFRIEPLEREGIFDFGLEDEGSILTLWEVSSLGGKGGLVVGALVMLLKWGKKVGFFFLVVIGIWVLGNFCYRVPLPELERQVLRGINGELLQGLRELPYASPEEVPENLKRAVVRVEDRRFYWHLGVDPIAILRAMRFNLTSIGKVQGASTLPQQLVKLTEKAYHRSWKQKLWEMGLAFNLSLHYSKQELLLAYLNQVEFLNGVRGYRSACLSYFGKECAALFPSELSFLIATAQTGKNPLRQGDFQLIKEKAEALCHVAFSKEQCDRWEELPPLSAKALLLQPNRSVFQFSDYYLGGSGAKGQDSSFDVPLYERIEQVISSSEHYRQQMQMEDCCVLVLDAAGEVRSMNTCRPFYEKEQGMVNGCLSKRQTGSAIKPFLYLFAMNALPYTGGTKIVDEPVSYYLDEEHIYSPKNFSLSYHGEVSLADALGNSFNVPAVKLLHEVGIEGFIAFINQLRLRFGGTRQEVITEEGKVFNAQHLGLSAALGTYELSPLEFAQFWRVFLEGAEEGLVASKVIDEVFGILSENRHRVVSFGIDNYLDVAGWAVKSGTSRHFVDGWTCGANREKQRIVCVWAGNYDATPMKESGSVTAGYLWNLVVRML